MAKSRPSFDAGGPPPSTRPSTGWVYRSEGAAPGERVSDVPPDAGTAGPPPERDARALRIVRKYSIRSAIAGAVPVPGLDIAAGSALQWTMIRALAAEYGVPFDADRLKRVLASAVSGLGAKKLGRRASASALKLVPGVGSLLGAVAGPASAYTVSYAIGRAFMRRFARAAATGATPH